MSGWIRLHRGWRDSEFFAPYRDQPFSEREAWLWLIESAAWKDTQRRNAKGEIVHVKRGQLHTSLRALETAWQWNKNSIDRFLKRLSAHEMIVLETGQSGCLVTLVNYGFYQADAPLEGQSWDSCGTAAGQPRDTQEESIKRDKKGKEKNDTARGSRLSGDWVLPDEWREFAKQEKGWSDHDVSAEANEFRDYWVAQSGQKGVKADWLATWRNWVRRSYRKPTRNRSLDEFGLPVQTYTESELKAYDNLMKGVL